MKKPKQIMWMHSHFLYWMGGTKYIYEVIRRLVKTNNVTVIVENASEYAITNYEKIGIKVVSLNKMSSTNPLYWLTFPYQVIDTYIRVKKVLPDRRYTLIVSMFPMNVVAWLLNHQYYQLCFEPFAFFHDPHFVNGFALPKRMMIKLIKLLYSSLDKIASRKAELILTLNQVTQRGIQQIYGVKSTPIYTGIDTNHFHPHVSNKLRSKYKNTRIIIHSTDYTPVKGTDKMIKIFAKVRQQHKDVTLLITSTIDNKEAVKALNNLAQDLHVSQNTEFLGFVDYDILPQLYSLAVVLVQCSYSELSGTTSMALPVKEALSCGTMCIRSPVTTEDVIDGITGYLIDPRNEEQMVQGICQILAMNKDEYNKASKKARESIHGRYTWDNTVSILSSIIK